MSPRKKPMKPHELRNRRAIAGLTIRKLSEFSGISEATIGRIENGYRGATARTLSQLERALERKTKEPCQELYEAAKQSRDALLSVEPIQEAAAIAANTLILAIRNFEGRK